METLKEEALIRSQGQTLWVLEAGCGRRWPFDIAGVKIRLTGIDMDPSALGLRRDLDEAILGDIRTAEFESESFDVIYCSYVLEHVQNAQLALENFVRWVKPGGLILVRVPDRNSVYGFITRMTPLWFHRWAKRYILGNRKSGLPGHGPYPTHHEPIIGRDAMASFARERGLEFESEFYGRLPGWKQLAAEVFAAMSLGLLSGKHVNVLYVMRKAA